MKRRRLLLGCVAIPSMAGCVGDRQALLGGDDTSEAVFGVGEIAVYIDGEPVDLSADRFQAEYADDYAIEFHLHEFDDHWYMEGDRRVTVAEALDKLPEFSYRVEADGDILQIDDETYDARQADVTIEIRINNDDVDPETYTLEDGDEILVEVQTGV